MDTYNFQNIIPAKEVENGNKGNKDCGRNQ